MTSSNSTERCEPRSTCFATTSAVLFALAAGAAWRVARPRLGLVCAALSAWAIAGARPGWSSLMVLLSRPAAPVTALDIFGTE